MKKLNNHGFTLIESIISFAILAIAGGMFILGFYNVSVIASEGSLIKTTANDLYDNLSSRTITDSDLDKNITMSVNGTPIIVQGKELEESSSISSSNSSFTVAFKKFVSNQQAEKMPDTIQDEDITKATLNFYLLWRGSAGNYVYPKDTQVNTSIQGKGGVRRGVWIDKVHGLQKNVITTLYNEEYVKSVLWYIPQNTELYIDNLTPANSIIWYQIISKGNNVYDIVGYETFDFRGAHISILDTNGVHTLLDADMSWTKDDILRIKTKININTKFKYIKDGKLYTLDQISEIADSADKAQYVFIRSEN